MIKMHMSPAGLWFFHGEYLNKIWWESQLRRVAIPLTVMDKQHPLCKYSLPVSSKLNMCMYMTARVHMYVILLYCYVALEHASTSSHCVSHSLSTYRLLQLNTHADNCAYVFCKNTMPMDLCSSLFLSYWGWDGTDGSSARPREDSCGTGLKPRIGWGSRCYTVFLHHKDAAWCSSKCKPKAIQSLEPRYALTKS